MVDPSPSPPMPVPPSPIASSPPMEFPSQAESIELRAPSMLPLVVPVFMSLDINSPR